MLLVGLPSVTFPPFVTASAWGTLVAQLDDLATKKRGSNALTNSDVVRFVMAWLAAIPRERIRELFPLWHQYAALAYGWNPKTNRFDTTVKRAAATYPPTIAAELWRTMKDIAAQLDAEVMPNPRLDLDGSFMDVVFQAEVRAELAQDGARAQGFPTPACKDKDGRVRLPRHCMGKPRKAADGTCYYIEPITGAKVRCDCPGECKPVIIDPLAPSKGLLLFALIIAAWIAFDNKPRRGRRK